VALGQVALARREAGRARAGLGATLVLGLAFLAIKGFEWSVKLHHGLLPGSPHALGLPPGEQVFYSLYFVMTGLHGLHVVAGLSVLGWMLRGLLRGTVRRIQVENAGLFWHLVDVIWIFLLPLFYLAA
jgi:cytochrome c oxidase subunit III